MPVGHLVNGADYVVADRDVLVAGEIDDREEEEIAAVQAAESQRQQQQQAAAATTLLQHFMSANNSAKEEMDVDDGVWQSHEGVICQCSIVKPFFADRPSMLDQSSESLTAALGE